MKQNFDSKVMDIKFVLVKISVPTSRYYKVLTYSELQFYTTS
jgi:hypothetical protein